MTPFEMAVEAALITIAKGLTVVCVCLTVVIVGTAFWKGRGDVWPDDEWSGGDT